LILPSLSSPTPNGLIRSSLNLIRRETRIASSIAYPSNLIRLQTSAKLTSNLQGDKLLGFRRGALQRVTSHKSQ
jgi:hypothetical protein